MICLWVGWKVEVYSTSPYLLAPLPTHIGRQADPATAADVLKAALQLLRRLVLWVSPELLMRPEMNFLQVFWCV